jgi:hypothetical protein
MFFVAPSAEVCETIAPAIAVGMWKPPVMGGAKAMGM